MEKVQSIQKYFKGKSVLVTGYRGYVGSTVAQFMADIDCRLILLDIADSEWEPKNPVADMTLVRGDITIPETWCSALKGVDNVFHLAALEYDRSNFDVRKDWEVNALSVFHLVETCRRDGFHPKIVFASSANIFGFVEDLPVNESHKDNPPSLWSAHKRLAEDYLRVYSQRYGVESIILRLANVYGPSACPDLIDHVVVNKVILQALAGKKLRVFGNHDCKRDLVYIDDVAWAFLLAGACDDAPWKGNFYIIGGESAQTIREVWGVVAEKVGALIGKDLHVENDLSVKLEPLDMRDFVANASLFRKLTGWKPEMAVEKGIEATVHALASTDWETR